MPCRTDEPALGRTLAQAWASWRPVAAGRTLEVLVCLNGAPGEGAALRDVHAFARTVAAAPVDIPVDVDVERGGGLPPPPAGAAPAVVALHSALAGKARAWNALRRHARGTAILFMDADVSFAPETFGLLLEALARHPAAVLASARTAPAARPTWFARVMAAPYGVAFPNLSPQLYAARTAGLPVRMPEGLCEPERWRELTVGAAHIVHAPAARVVVRMPATLRDFFWQRVRIEMGKVQLAAEHPQVLGRGAVQPTLRDVLRQLPAAEVARLGVYLALRAPVHAVARRWYRRGRTAGVWRQPTSTKWERGA